MDIRSSLLAPLSTLYNFFRSLSPFNHRIIIVMKCNYIRRVRICFLLNVGSAEESANEEISLFIYTFSKLEFGLGPLICNVKYPPEGKYGATKVITHDT